MKFEIRCQLAELNIDGMKLLKFNLKEIYSEEVKQIKPAQ